MEHAKAEAEVVKKLTESALNIKPIKSIHTDSEIIFVPDHINIKTLDAFRDNPKRIQIYKFFNSLGSFNQYVMDFKTESSVIFCSPENNELFTCLFDYHTKDNPSWCTHSAGFNLIYTDRWNRLIHNNGKKLSQRNFANFIEDNSELIAEPNVTGLLEEIKGVQLKSDIFASSNITNASERHTNNGKYEVTTLKTELIKFSVCPARFSQTYTVNARLYVFIDTSEHKPKIEFKYSLINHEESQEHMVDSFIKQVEKGTQIKPYI